KVRLQENGYQKLPSGLVIQWGIVENVSFSNRQQNITFPISFPTAVVFVRPTILGNIDLVDDTASIECYSMTTSGFVAYNIGDRNPASYMWMAMGY
ncbi:gp53-like domain-containing protein, partial [Pectobacterium cacticida]